MSLNLNLQDPMMQSMNRNFSAAWDSVVKKQGALEKAIEAGDQGEINAAQNEVQKAMQIMSTLSNISQTIHNMLMKLIEKLNIRS